MRRNRLGESWDLSDFQSGNPSHPPDCEFIGVVTLTQLNPEIGHPNLGPDWAHKRSLINKLRKKNYSLFSEI